MNNLADELERERERLDRLALDIEAHQAIVDHFRPRYEATFEKDSPTAAFKMTLYPHVITHEHTIRDWKQELEDRRAILSALRREEWQGIETAPKGIYVASRASVPERPAMWRALRDQGFPIISTWIDEAGEGETACNRELWSRIEREVTSAERLIFYVEPGDLPLKGAYIEVGMALAAGVPVFVVAEGVKLEPVTMRPLGSWTQHPLVRFCDTVEIACRAALPPPPTKGTSHE